MFGRGDEVRFEAISIWRREFLTEVLVNQLVFNDDKFLIGFIARQQPLFKLRLLRGRQSAEQILTNSLLLCCVCFQLT